MAVGAFSRDVAVSQESLGFFIVVLLTFLFDKFAFIVERSKELGGRFFVYGTRRATINIEADAEGFKGIFNEFVIAIYDVLRRAMLAAGANRYRYAVLIRSADEEDRLVAQAQIAGVNIRRDIDAGQMADVDPAIGVGQRSCDQRTIEGLLRHVEKRIKARRAA